MALTNGEALFEQYLAERGLLFEYESAEAAGNRRPDYRVMSDPVVHCEVKDFTFGPHDEAEMESLRTGPRVGSASLDAMFVRIRDTIAKAAKQLRAHKGKACIVVLHNANSFVQLAPFFVGSAMFGDPVISVSLGGGKTTSRFTRNRELAATKNTTVSAVAVLSRTRANQHLIDETMARLGPWKGRRLPSKKRVTTVVTAIAKLLKEKPEAGLMVPYLTLHHNPYAVAALPEHVFNGPHDKQIRYA